MVEIMGCLMSLLDFYSSDGEIGDALAKTHRKQTEKQVSTPGKQVDQGRKCNHSTLHDSAVNERSHNLNNVNVDYC